MLCFQERISWEWTEAMGNQVLAGVDSHPRESVAARSDHARGRQDALHQSRDSELDSEHEGQFPHQLCRTTWLGCCPYPPGWQKHNWVLEGLEECQWPYGHTSEGSCQVGCFFICWNSNRKGLYICIEIWDKIIIVYLYTAVKCYTMVEMLYSYHIF